jgi:hypothetical protein
MAPFLIQKQRFVIVLEIKIIGITIPTHALRVGILLMLVGPFFLRL